jgi:hypothetical protein
VSIESILCLEIGPSEACEDDQRVEVDLSYSVTGGASVLLSTKEGDNAALSIVVLSDPSHIDAIIAALQAAKARMAEENSKPGYDLGF